MMKGYVKVRPKSRNVTAINKIPIAKTRLLGGTAVLIPELDFFIYR